jgi:hypothetical protein
MKMRTTDLKKRMRSCGKAEMERLSWLQMTHLKWIRLTKEVAAVTISWTSIHCHDFLKLLHLRNWLFPSSSMGNLI